MEGCNIRHTTTNISKTRICLTTITLTILKKSRLFEICWTTKIEKKEFKLFSPPSSFCILSPAPFPSPLLYVLWCSWTFASVPQRRHQRPSFSVRWLVSLPSSHVLKRTRQRRREQDPSMRFMAEGGWTSSICIYIFSSFGTERGWGVGMGRTEMSLVSFLISKLRIREFPGDSERNAVSSPAWL